MARACMRSVSQLPLHFSIFSSCALVTARRQQASDQFHRYLHNPHIVQPDGIDPLPRTKGDQQQWLNTEQWDGYSETYLSRHMQYPATAEHPIPQLNPRHDLLNGCLRRCYELYGPLAEQLHTLQDDPLHPNFHSILACVRKEREKIAAELDRVYAALHPTVKLLYDAFLVRRYYQIGDWADRVERRRHDVLERLSPEYIRQAERAKGVAAHFISRLRHLEAAFTQNPTLGLLEDEGQRYSLEEVAMLRQKAAYFRKMRSLGANQQNSDVHTH